MKQLILLLIPFLTFAQSDVPEKYWIDDNIMEQRPNIPRGINNFFLFLIKINAIKNVNSEIISLYENQ